MMNNHIRLAALKQLKKNLSKAISIIILLISVIIVVPMIFYITKVFVETLFNNVGTTFGIKSSILAAIIFCTIISAIFIAPLFLNVKLWFTVMITGRPPLSRAFCFFEDIKFFKKTVIYCVFKMAIIFIPLALLFIPEIKLAIFFQHNISSPNKTNGIIFSILFILMLIYFVVVTVLAIYYLVSLFYTDYIYFKYDDISLITVVKRSFALTKRTYAKLVALIFSMLPYILLCLFIIPIIFVLPYKKAVFARFALEQVGNKTINTKAG